MKNFLPILVFAITSFLAGCCVFTNVRHPATKNTLVDNLKSDTVAFVQILPSGEAIAWCAGVWVDRDRVLTAEHCIRGPVEELVNGLSVDSEDEAEELIEKFEDGFNITYMIASESNEAYQPPQKTHKLTVIKHDKYHDLALLQVSDYKDIPKHSFAQIANVAPSAGEDLHIMGHPIGLTWTYIKGVVAANRSVDFQPLDKIGPFMQVIGAVWKGNSGGGAFNVNGELVGIASFVVPSPEQSMFIHLDSIKDFLNIKH